MEDIDAFIAECHSILDQRVDIPIDDWKQRLYTQSPPHIESANIPEIVTLCLFYEDMLNGRPEAESKSLFAWIVKDLRERLQPHKEALKFIQDQADGFFTTEDCMSFLRHLHEKLLKIESSLG